MHPSTNKLSKDYRQQPLLPPSPQDFAGQPPTAAGLRALGADKYDMMLPEAHSLHLVIRPGERLIGLVFGRYHYHRDDGTIVGRGVLVATDQHILLLDKKPVYVSCDQISYDVVSGVYYSRVWVIGTVQLHTRIGDIRMRTFNQHCARNFVEAIEAITMSRTRFNPPDIPGARNFELYDKDYDTYGD